MNEISSYEKQLLWKLAASKKAEKLHKESNMNKEPSFQPKFYSNNNIKNFEGHARNLTDASGKRHIDRQNKARKERDIPDLSHDISRHVDPRSLNKQIPVEVMEYASPQSHLNNDDEDDDYESEEGYLNAHMEHTSNDNSNLTEHNAIETEYLSDDGSSVTEEPIIELLERERREWRSEREKLIQCIHLQQLELTQRSLAAHERAVDIAKEFAKAIETFEERLMTVESSVQREILSIKSIAEAILAASTGKGGAGPLLDNLPISGGGNAMNPTTPSHLLQSPPGNFNK